MHISYDYILLKNSPKSFSTMNYDTTCEVRIYCKSLFAARKTFTFSPTTTPKEIQRRFNETCRLLHLNLVTSAEKSLAEFIVKCETELMGG